MLEIKGLKKSFPAPDGGRQGVIDVPSFALDSREQVALSGESGQGKTTLLHLIAGILRPDAGTIQFDGQTMSELPEPARDRLRALEIGYIFQSFNLLPAFSCLENVLLAMGFGRGPDRVRAEALLNRVNLGDRLHYHPRKLSTGQQQRLAVARALANGPKLVLADEPTGSLDARNANEALKLIRETCRENHSALLLVTHDPQVLGEFEHVRQFRRINRNGPEEAGA